ncbi:uncharacterized protein LOC116118275 [Pistacia vera]|uniref:uncharacterized protein LOC116118275 n=1 Tax=Pistacia vera TaxID=55513 RepID=UPI001262AF4B|nr:uncharacterized protein LOC116118275 [Pistacia vera]
MSIFSNTTRIPPLIFLTFHLLLLLLLSVGVLEAQAKCKTGCRLALASYYVPNQDSIPAGERINVPFSCDCLNGDFLGHTFTYETVFGDTYDKVASLPFANLTTEDWVHRVQHFDPTRIPDGALIMSPLIAPAVTEACPKITGCSRRTLFVPARICPSLRRRRLYRPSYFRGTIPESISVMRQDLFFSRREVSISFITCQMIILQLYQSIHYAKI